MEVTQVLTSFDQWHAGHTEKCGVNDVSVHMERTDTAATRLVLSCPVCGKTISGVIDDADMRTVIRALKPENTH